MGCEVFAVGGTEARRRPYQSLEQRLELGQPSSLRIRDRRREPRLESFVHQKLTVARRLMGTVRNLCGTGSSSMFHPNFTESSKPNGPDCRPPPPSAK